MNKLLLTTAMFCFLSLSCAHANNAQCDGTVTNPCVVKDKNDHGDVKHWRTAAMIRDAYKGNTAGLKDRWVSVSAVPTEKSFKNIAKEIDKLTNGKYKKIIDVDLREESHAYLNGKGITLQAEHNWVNKGKTHAQVVADEQAWVDQLSNKGAIANVLTGKQFDKKDFDEGISIKIKTLDLEQALVERVGFEYVRLTVSDHLRPSDAETDAFVKLIDATPERVWLHMHCRGGNGRSTTFFAMYDMLKNADKVSFNDIIKRQASVKPFYDLADVNRKQGDNKEEYLERFEFLKQFYMYAGDKLRGYTGNWTQWLKRNS